MTSTSHRNHFVAQQILTACIVILIATLLYAVGIEVSNSLLHRHGSPSLAVFLLLTLVVSVAISVARRHVEHHVALFMFGKDADAYANVNTFVTRIANSLAVDEVVPRLAEAAARTMHSGGAEVRLWLSDGEEWSQAWPPEHAREVAPGIVVDVTHRGKELAEIDVDAPVGGVAADRSPLDEIVRPAGLALSTVQLTLDLRRRASEAERLNRRLHASRQRIIDARRVERDLVLADLGRNVDVHLRTADKCLQRGTKRLQRGGSDLVVDVCHQLDAANEAARAGLEALRKLARGVFPPVLAEYGAVVALDVWAKSTSPAVHVEVHGDQARLRSSAEVETALYFVCVAAVTEVPLSLARTIRLVIGDDEVTVAAPVGGALAPSLIQLFVDRFEALGGTLRIEHHDDDMRILLGSLPLKRGEVQ